MFKIDMQMNLGEFLHKIKNATFQEGEAKTAASN